MWTLLLYLILFQSCFSSSQVLAHLEIYKLCSLFEIWPCLGWALPPHRWKCWAECVRLGTFMRNQCHFLKNVNSVNMRWLTPYSITVIYMGLNVAFVEGNLRLMGQVFSYSSLKGNIVTNRLGCLINMKFPGEDFVNDNTQQLVRIHIFQFSIITYDTYMCSLAWLLFDILLLTTHWLPTFSTKHLQGNKCNYFYVKMTWIQPKKSISETRNYI